MASNPGHAQSTGHEQDQQQQLAPAITTSDPEQSLLQHQRTAEARTAFTATLTSVSKSLDSELIDRARVLHNNATAIESQEEQVRHATAQLGRRNDELESIIGHGWEGLKEIGDVQNWAEFIERDLLVVEETLRLTDERLLSLEGAADGDCASEEEQGEAPASVFASPPHPHVGGAAAAEASSSIVFDANTTAAADGGSGDFAKGKKKGGNWSSRTKWW